MLNELIIGRMKCPVCGRYMFGNLKQYWCPFCGNSNNEEINNVISSPTERITNRDENGVAVYIGAHSFNNYTYAPYLNEYAKAEVLEKLCVLEEEKESNDYIQGEDE